MRNAIVVLLCAVLSGCQTWHRDSAALIRTYRPHDQLQVWTRGVAYLVHGVRVSGDSLVAVPIEAPADSARFAIRLPLSLVDSIRAQRPDQSRTLLLQFAVSGTIAWIVFCNAMAAAND